MVDSGSAPHVANMQQHFPGATLRKQTQGQQMCIQMATATGGAFSNNGEFGIAFKTQEWHH